MAPFFNDDCELDPDFDPATMTIPRLRCLLTKHAVRYPGSCKKAQLIQLVRQHILPRAEELRRTRDAVVPTEVGIINADDSSAAPEEDDDASGGRGGDSGEETGAPATAEGKTLPPGAAMWVCESHGGEEEEEEGEGMGESPCGGGGGESAAGAVVGPKGKEKETPDGRFWGAVRDYEVFTKEEQEAAMAQLTFQVGALSVAMLKYKHL